MEGFQRFVYPGNLALVKIPQHRLGAAFEITVAHFPAEIQQQFNLHFVRPAEFDILVGNPQRFPQRLFNIKNAAAVYFVKNGVQLGFAIFDKRNFVGGIKKQVADQFLVLLLVFGKPEHQRLQTGRGEGFEFIPDIAE